MEPASVRRKSEDGIMVIVLETVNPSDNSNNISSSVAIPRNANEHTVIDDFKRNVSNTSTLSSIICVVAGSGILAIAHALSQSGWIGLIFLLLSACMSQFTGIILIKCLYNTKYGRLRDYADIGYVAFGMPGQIIGYTFSQLMLFLTPTIYTILASEIISDILDQYGFIWLDRRACIWIIAFVVGVPFILVRNMKDVSYFSTLASMATLCLLLVVCAVCMTDFSSKTHIMHHNFAIIKNLPMSISTFNFSYCGHVLYPQLEASMATPKRWPKVLLVATGVITLMYFAMGFMCYSVFGDTAQSPIYKSLPVGSTQNIAMLVITVHVILAVPFYLYVFTTRIESYLNVQGSNTPTESESNNLQTYPNQTAIKDDLQKDQLARTILRIGEMVLISIIAMFVPYFTDLMAFVGTIFSVTLTFILPCLFWMKLNWKESKTNAVWYYIEFSICFIVATIGVCCATLGTFDAVKLIGKDQ